MSIYKRGKTWTVQIVLYDKDKKRHFKTKGGFKTKKEASLWEDQQNLAKNAGRLSTKQYVFLDYFKRWAELYRLPGKAPNTIKRYEYIEHVIENYFGKKKLSELTRASYQDFLNQYGKDHAKNTVSKTTKVIASCLKDAYAEGVISSDVTFKARLTYDEDKTRNPQYLSIDELKALTDQLKTKLNPQNTSRYVILTAIATGARIGEILALRWSDIYNEAQTISITRSYDYVHDDFKVPKTKSSIRTIKITQKLLDLLKPLKVNHQPLIFARPSGELPTPNAVNKALRYNMNKVGLKKRDFHFHSLRHCHVAYLYSQGVDWYKISQRLGHSSVAFTMKVYSYLISEKGREQDKKILSALDKIDI